MEDGVVTSIMTGTTMVTMRNEVIGITDDEELCCIKAVPVVYYNVINLPYITQHASLPTADGMPVLSVFLQISS